MNRDYTANCAICGGPGDPECPCEGERLKVAIDQAEQKWVASWMAKTRAWVTNNAIETITTIYNKKKEMRKTQYLDYIHSLPYYPMYEQYRGRPPLQPYILAQLQAQIRDADMDLKRGIDADWKSCVVRYPEVLTHFYNQIAVNPPRQAEPPFGLGGQGPGLPPPPPRAPSVNPQAQNMYSQAPGSIMRSNTAPPKKNRERRSSRVAGDDGGGGGGKGAGFNEDIFAQLQTKLAGIQMSKAGRGTPAPSTAETQGGGRGQRPGGKRRESKDFMQTGRFNAPPQVPQPPSFHGGGGGFGFGHF